MHASVLSKNIDYIHWHRTIGYKIISIPLNRRDGERICGSLMWSTKITALDLNRFSLLSFTCMSPKKEDFCCWVGLELSTHLRNTRKWNLPSPGYAIWSFSNQHFSSAFLGAVNSNAKGKHGFAFCATLLIKVIFWDATVEDRLFYFRISSSFYNVRQTWALLKMSGKQKPSPPESPLVLKGFFWLFPLSCFLLMYNFPIPFTNCCHGK